MSNNEMVSVPRGLLAEAEVALRQTGMDVSLSADLRALLAEPAAQTQSDPVVWVTVYRRSGSKDRIEFGEENRERDITALTWGWSVSRESLHFRVTGQTEPVAEVVMQNPALAR